MRILLLLAAAATSLLAQNPAVQLMNTSRPGAADFVIGDYFQITITAAANQAVSIRTIRGGRTDWSPVIGQTDGEGHWSTSGRFQQADYGDWSERWTVGGHFATPFIDFSVSAPCLKGRPGMMFFSGPNRVETCETAQGKKTFGGTSYDGPVRAPDGRMISTPVALDKTAKDYRVGMLKWYILGNAQPIRLPAWGDDAANLITEMIGGNALTEQETENVIAIVRNAFAKSHSQKSATIQLLQTLANAAQRENLKQQIAGTIAYVESR